MDSSDANVSSIPLTESSSSQSKIPPPPPSPRHAKAVDQQPPPLAEIAEEELATIAVDNVAAVFVVRFDVIHGNTIEWQYPTELDLNGIEYQAICSGHHRVRSDTVFFIKPPYFGVSIFRNVDNVEEGQRGACMRAVGVIVEPNASTGPNAKVWIHGHALNVLAKSFDFETDDNEQVHKHLHHYFEKHRLRHRGEISSSLSSPWSPSASDLKAFRPATLLYYNPTQSFAPIFEQLTSVEPRPPLEIVPRLDAFPFFVAQFGPQIFVLWKAALLKKRILFLTTPPLQRACGYVYNTFLLGALPKSSVLKSRRKLHPKYAVGVNDIADLYDFADGYVACTSDTIFESKTELYDLVVDLCTKENDTRSWYAFAKGTPRIKSTSELPHRHNAADFHRFRSAIRQIFDTARDMGFAQDDDELNDQLGSALESKANCRDAVSTALFQLILWYYRPHQPQHQQPQQQQKASSSSSSPSSWQRIFAGNAAAASKQNRKKKGLQDNVPMDPEEQEALLLGNGEDLADEERDATEINNNDVFDVVAARASSEEHRQQRRIATGDSIDGQQQQLSVPDTRKWGVHEKLTAALVGFFHTLSYQTLAALDSLLSMNENGDTPDDPIMLTAQDMIQLGLHPTDDALFVRELALLYFEKTVEISDTCQGACCNSCCKKEVHGGSIRI